MEHRVPRSVGQQFIDNTGIREIRHDKPNVGRHSGAMSGLEIVQHHHGVTALDEGRDQVTADIAGSPGDQKSPRHCSLLPEVGAVAGLIHLRIGVA